MLSDKKTITFTAAALNFLLSIGTYFISMLVKSKKTELVTMSLIHYSVKKDGFCGLFSPIAENRNAAVII